MNWRPPHNALFVQVFSDVRHAARLLRSLLPVAVARRVDWDTLKLVSAHFVDKTLRTRQGDLLYHAKLRGGGDVLFYVVLEHQSSSSPMMALRLLRYEVRIWDWWLENNPGQKRLPVIIPVVLSHAKGGWRAPTQFQDLVELPDDLTGELGTLVPSFRYVVDDLAKQTDQQLMNRGLEAFLTLTLPAARRAQRAGSGKPPARVGRSVAKTVAS